MAVSLAERTWNRRSAIETQMKIVTEAMEWSSMFLTVEDIEARQNVSTAGAGVGRNMVTGIGMGVGDGRDHHPEEKRTEGGVGVMKEMDTGIDS